MSLIDCPECGGRISDKAVMCPHCGYSPCARWFGGEYRSKAEYLGLPIVHIIMGPGFDPLTGRIRIAKGIIAIGPIAAGGLAVGAVSVGVVSLGGVAAGAFALGGLAVGVILALGGLAVGLVAVGGAAIGYYALGGGAAGVHALGGNASDPQAVRFFKDLFGPDIHPGR